MSQSAGLFLGVETFTWQLSDFKAAVDFAKSLNFTQLIVKVYEITQGDWYQDLGGSLQVVNYILSLGLDVLPYGYFYGFNPGVEVAAAANYLHQFGKFCLDMEGEFDNNPAAMQPYHDGLVGHVGDLYISTWANPLNHNWGQNIAIMDPIVKVWMPQVYTPYLAGIYGSQWQNNPKIQPTFNAFSDGTSLSTWHSPVFSVWEYQGVQSWLPAQKGFFTNMLDTAPVPNFKQLQFDVVWYCPSGHVPTGYKSGIYKACNMAFLLNDTSACFPTSDELDTFDWNGVPIKYQTLSNGCHAEFYVSTGSCLIYDPEGSGIYRSL